MTKGTLKTIAATTVLALAVAVPTAAIMKSGGFAFETSGMKISLDLKSPTGAKVIFQRAE